MRLNIALVVLLLIASIAYAGKYKQKVKKVDKKAFHKESVPQVCLGRVKAHRECFLQAPPKRYAQGTKKASKTAAPPTRLPAEEKIDVGGRVPESVKVLETIDAKKAAAAQLPVEEKTDVEGRVPMSVKVLETIDAENTATPPPPPPPPLRTKETQKNEKVSK